ncbi:aminotransferase class I/II-fold pyridoxal phosphate-dependent enzyme [Lutibacter sp. A64]|uniref:aminotransferase class I/II-fold pyridoxal phosphate-dependent enzyme n=1 Tax=Lutibacter sp. A64 TaxID=2918526 RepID=UPI001F05CDE9|nr:aminotransferase class I/II-fold pyridoxal phosphate-dependent enzyme [Lutibacter sp. A64]UMB54209.1 aminotransferase class I/II-fold pyridoxal phosphate-dependent enzyme [Lutibacter sp. A64]
MAKIKSNNFLDTVNDVFIDARKAGVIHLYAEDESFSGRTLQIHNKKLFHFGTTGYLGLEQDARLKKAAINAITKYGTQFPLSKSYISHPLYNILEQLIREMYGTNIIITKNSTLGHLGVIPSAVNDQDAIILDHQVHWSVQSAAKTLKSRSVTIEMIRHNNLQMLEDKIKALSSKHKRIWYMVDGIYSMYGDYAPIKELLELCNKYPQLFLYCDDVHGMSWIGKKGTGFVLSQLNELPENILIFGTLSKTFGASGAFLACSDTKMYQRIKTFGGPLTFSAQLEPASVGAAIASARIHLSPEIYTLQSELKDRIDLFNDLLSHTDLPLVHENNSPVFYIGTGMPKTGYNFVNRLMNEGFFVNLGLFPAVPVKNTGVRITISRHNQKEEIKSLVEAMVYHFPKALADTNTTKKSVFSAFKIATPSLTDTESLSTLSVQMVDTIKKIQKEEWNALLGKHGIFDWDGLLFLENVFNNNAAKEHNWKFYYFIIRDAKNKPILATFFTFNIWKEDMLASEKVSIKLEAQRVKNPYLYTSYVLSMGSLFTEGQHYYFDKTHPKSKLAFNMMFQKLEGLDVEFNPSMLVLRDFEIDADLNQKFHQQGFIKTNMPDSCIIENLAWKSTDEYIATLSSRNRRHFRKDILPFESCFEITIKSELNSQELFDLYELYENVRKNNRGLNTFSFPIKMLKNMSNHPNWEFIILSLKKELNSQNNHPVGVMFCYKNGNYSYTPAFVGLNYKYLKKYQIYRQLLFQTIKRAGELHFKNINFGMTAAFEKKKLGAKITSKIAYIQAKDNFSMEMMDAISNEDSY